MFQVRLLLAGYEGDGDVGLGLEVEVPEGGAVLGVLVERGAGEWTLAPDDAGDVGRELRDVGVGDHPSNIVPHDVNRLFDAHVLRDQCVQVLREHVLGVAIGRMRRVSSTAVVWSYDPIAGFGEGDGDVAELVGCLREAVDEEDGTLGLAGGGKTVDVVDPDLRVGLLEPDLAVVGDRGVLGRHCRGRGGRNCSVART